MVVGLIAAAGMLLFLASGKAARRALLAIFIFFVVIGLTAPGPTSEVFFDESSSQWDADWRWDPLTNVGFAFEARFADATWASFGFSAIVIGLVLAGLWLFARPLVARLATDSWKVRQT